MAEIYGHRWVSSFGETPSPMWCSALNRISDEQVRRGIANCITQRIEWPPTLTDFIGLCVTVPGLPSADEAADDAIAIARKWKRPDQCLHPIVWHCLDQIGGFNGIAEDVLRKRFLSNYERAKQDLSEGRPLSAIPQPLPAPKDAQPDYTSEQALASKAAAIAKIKAMFNGG